MAMLPDSLSFSGPVKVNHFRTFSDVLINLFIVQLQVLDAIDKSRKFHRLIHKNFKHLDSFQCFVTSLSIPNFQFWVGQN